MLANNTFRTDSQWSWLAWSMLTSAFSKLDVDQATRTGWFYSCLRNAAEMSEEDLNTARPDGDTGRST